jgi:putative metalloenzyme radical SAM/SPASM domain maturase
LEEFIERAKKLLPERAWVGFQSNGMLLTEERTISLINSGLDRICISVDALSQDNFSRIREGGDVGDVKRAISALNRAKGLSGRQDFSTGIEFVLMRDNLRELSETLRWAAHNGVTFALITQLLPYDKTLVSHSVYDTNTHGAIQIYKQWKRKAEDEGIKIDRYFDTFMKYFKKPDEEMIFNIIEQMKADAVSHEIALHVERLLRRDEDWFKRVEEIFDEARQIGEDEGIHVTLPEIAPKNNRKCEFVETDSAFVSWDGNVHPCYFLWHRYGCYVGGWEKKVKPWVFGHLSDNDIIEIWNSPDFMSFREAVLHYDFPFCFDCSFALCDLAQREDFEQDCYTNSIPCGACLWCTGLFHCLQ